MKKIRDSWDGQMVNGQVVWKDDRRPPEGIWLVFKVLPRSRTSGRKSAKKSRKSANPRSRKSVWQLMLELSGKARGLPPDFARNHDHYVHGAAKR